jgi:glycosyltransferase involved in cell wall biosynthesis
MTEEPRLSVLVPVHPEERPSHVDRALRSVVEQSVPPDEVVVVVDEPTPMALSDVIAKWSDRLEGLRKVYTPDSETLGGALQAGLEDCRGRFVARMDADDVASPVRFERQLQFIDHNPGVDVVGSYLAEFESDPDEIRSVRAVPTDHEAIAGFARRRNPMNHPTVTFRRESVLDVGGYRPLPGIEDYDLWARALSEGLRFANLPEVLVAARAGSDLIDRRGGLTYARWEFDLQRCLRETGLVGLPGSVRNLLVRVPVRLVPDRVRQSIYRRFAREGPPDGAIEPAYESSGETLWE